MNTDPLETGVLMIKPAGSLVYIARSWTDQVLYVGVTDDICQRMARHRSESGWWPDAREVTWELWPTRTRALRREAELIGELVPAWNVVMNGGSRRPAFSIDAWARLGEAVARCRTAARMTQKQLADESGIVVRELRRLEHGQACHWPPDRLAGLEHALGWRADGCITVLVGGDPPVMTGEERQERALAAARVFHGDVAR